MYGVFVDGVTVKLTKDFGDGIDKCIAVMNTAGFPGLPLLELAQEMVSVLNDSVPGWENRPVKRWSSDPSRNADDGPLDEARLDGGSWKPASQTSDEEAQDVVGQPVHLPYTKPEA